MATSFAIADLIGEIFDAAELEPDDAGELRLPGWLRIYCPTAERSAQTSASTVRTGFAAHAARAYSADGSSWGLLVERAAVNLIDEQDLSAWAAGGSPVVTGAVAPDGDTEICDVEDDDAGVAEYLEFIPTFVAGEHTLTAWFLTTTPVPTTWSAITVWDFSLSFAYATIHHTGVDSAWTLESVSNTFTAPTNPGVLVVPRDLTASDTGSTAFWGLQLESGAYPTSFIGADNATFERAADTLLATPGSVAPDGYFDIEIVYAPQYAYGEPASDHTLLCFDEDNKVIYDHTLRAIVFTIGGETLSNGGCTFSRLQTLTVRATHTATGRSLTVSGATAGNGTWTGDALDPIKLPHMAYVLGTADGAEEGAVLYKLDPHLTSYADFGDARALSQVDNVAGFRNFRDMLRIVAKLGGRIVDVVRTVMAALELQSAAGDQLDKIGSWVCLPREGFTDDRYRVFLGIQCTLLLAAARADAEWTGTVPNIVAIARMHVGSAGGAIQMLNTPPYHFMLQIVALSAAENALLARFLTTAVYAGVLGQLIPTLSADSVWQSAYYSPASASLLLDGVDEHVDFTDYPAADFDYDDPWSGAVWFKYSAASATAWQTLIGRHDGSDGWALQVGGGAHAGKVRFFLLDSSVPAYIERTIDVGADDDQWHCAGWRYDGSGLVSGLALTFDGADVTGATGATGSFVTIVVGVALIVGDDSVNGAAYKGAVMHSAVWNVERTADEMGLITGAPTPLALSDMLPPDGSDVHWCTLGDGCATGAGGCPDLSAQDKDGTAVNVEAGDFQADVPQTRAAISAGGIWDSDVTPIGGAMKWQSVIETS